MDKRICLVVSLILLSSISCTQTRREDVKVEEIKVEEIKARAEESMNAFSSGDYQKMIDLTYPKLVELMGGREKMVSTMEQQMKGMKEQGAEVISTSIGVPQEVVPVESQFFSIVPYTLRIKIPNGVLNQQSYLLAISNKDSIKWTFIDVTQINESQLKMVVPSAVGKVTFPEKQPPVFEENP
jgi:hypothetical protein